MTHAAAHLLDSISNRINENQNLGNTSQYPAREPFAPYFRVQSFEKDFMVELGKPTMLSISRPGMDFNGPKHAYLGQLDIGILLEEYAACIQFTI